MKISAVFGKIFRSSVEAFGPQTAEPASENLPERSGKVRWRATDAWFPPEDEDVRQDMPRTPIIDLATMRPWNEPVALYALQRDEQSVELLLQGLKDHYKIALGSGRMDKWKRAAHGIIDLVGDLEIVKRSDLN